MAKKFEGEVGWRGGEGEGMVGNMRGVVGVNNKFVGKINM